MGAGRHQGGLAGRCRTRAGRGKREAGGPGDGRARELRHAVGAGQEAAWAASRARGAGNPSRAAATTRPRACTAAAVKRARGAGGRKGWRCEWGRAGTGAPRCRCNKNASHATAYGEGRDRDTAARGGGKSGGGRPGGGGSGGREVKGLPKFSGYCGRRAPGWLRRSPQDRTAEKRRQAGYGPGAPTAPRVPGPAKAGTRGSLH